MFYTYAHVREDTGVIFYIGKGSGRRFNSKQGRSQWWNNVYAKTPISYHILAYWETEADAFAHERLLIACLSNLVNLTEGGEGCSGVPCSDKRKAEISKQFKGIPKSEDFKEFIRQEMEYNWKDLEFIKRQKLGIIKARGKPIKEISTDTDFPTVTDAVNWIRLRGSPRMSTSYLSRLIKHNRTANGYTFKYKDEI